MNEESTTPIAPASVETALEAVYRHIGRAHYRLATAEGIRPELAAACIDELYAAMELLEPYLPPLRKSKGKQKRRAVS